MNIKRSINSVLRAVIASSSIALLSACGGGSSSTSTSPPVVDSNNPPIIEVTQVSQVVEAGTTSVTLSITATDDSGVSTIAWSQIAGMSVALENANSSDASFVVPRVSIAGGDQQLNFRVVVTDNQGATAQSELSVLLKPNNQLPVIVAANPNQDVEQGQQVMLEISATDDSQVSEIVWTQTSGTAVVINNANSSQASFDAPAYSENSADNLLEFEVTVTDDDGDSAKLPLTVNILDENLLPIVEVNGPYDVFSYDEVVITVNATDSDGHIVSYLWENANPLTGVSFTQDEFGTLRFVAHGVRSFGIYDFRLIVTDNRGGQTQLEHRIKINALPPQFDLVNINAEQVVSGDIVRIDWQVTSGGNIREYRLNRADTGEHVPLTMLSDTSATFVTPFIQNETSNVEYVFTVEDVIYLTDESNFELTVSPYTGMFAPQRVLHAINRVDEDVTSFTRIEKMKPFGNGLAIVDREIIPDFYALKFENGALVVDESFDSSPWDNNYPIYSWLNEDYNNDGVKDAIVANVLTTSGNAQLVAVMLADDEGNLSTVNKIGEFDAEYNIQLHSFVDINGDGHRDLRFRELCINSICVENKETFLTYQTDTQTFELMENSNVIGPDGEQEEEVNFKVFADVNNNGKNELFGFTDVQEPCVNWVICGNLGMSMLDDQGAYQSLTSFDSSYLSANSLSVSDVNRDGIDDLVFDGFEQSLAGGEATAVKKWYHYEQDTGFSAISMPEAPKYYQDLNGNGQAYFFDIDNSLDKLTTYKYDELSKTPIIDTSYEITPGNKAHINFMDIDKDGDLDMVFTDDEQDPSYIYWIENLHL